MIPHRLGTGPSIRFFLLLSLVLSARAAVLHVPEEWPLIQTALDSMASGDTVLVAPGHYHERLVVPNKTVTLGSQTLQTGDTLFIPQTILDGDSLGTVVTIGVGGLHRFVLDGFTIQHGLGAMYHGGGIHFADSSDVVLRNLHFTNNYTDETGLPYGGAVIYGYAGYNGPKRIQFKHIRVFDNVINHQNHVLMDIIASHYAEARDIVCNNARNNILIFGSRDSVIINGFYSSGNVLDSAILLSSGLSSYTEHSYQEYSNIFVSNTTYNYGNLISFGGHSIARVNNIQLCDNRQLENWTGWSNHLFDFTGRGRCELDSIIFRRNQGIMSESPAGEIIVWRNILQEWNYGILTNLIIEDCTLGDGSSIEYNSNRPPYILSVTGCSIDGAKVSGNLIYMMPGPNSPISGVYGGSVLNVECYNSDSLFLRNMNFSDNTYIDGDNNSDFNVANFGKCLRVESGTYLNFNLSKCQFIDNNEQVSAHPIGSIIELVGHTSGNFNGTKNINHLIFKNNDNGGMSFKNETQLNLCNIQMFDMKRIAMWIAAESYTISNLLIDGVGDINSHSVCAVFSRPELPSVVRNSTITHSGTPYVFLTSQVDVSDPPGTRVTYESCLITDNTGTMEDSGTERPGTYNYCLLPVEPELGHDNLIDIDPVWDEDWFPPYLSPQSPCVDAGTPDPNWNDHAAQEPTMGPVWPCQGTLRNDIGVTGGPHAMAIFLNWQDLPPWEIHEFPLDFRLGAPWPNPFNPVVQVPFTLARPALVRLSIFNLLGQEVAVLVDDVLPAGRHQAQWGARQWASGIYLVTLEVGGRQETRAVTLLH